jgi:hypothetical protein
LNSVGPSFSGGPASHAVGGGVQRQAASATVSSAFSGARRRSTARMRASSSWVENGLVM